MEVSAVKLKILPKSDQDSLLLKTPYDIDKLGLFINKSCSKNFQGA